MIGLTWMLSGGALYTPGIDALPAGTDRYAYLHLDWHANAYARLIWMMYLAPDRR
jgi:hypothetical protein